MNTVDIIVPVYQGLEELRTCLLSVINSSIHVPHEIIIIEDGSPNPAIPEFLKKFSTEHDVTLLHNDINLGFVATVNRGMALNPEHDVLLLNSDTEVANDWLDRLQACAYSDPEIATVTPFSNNATICSYPVFCQSNELPHGYTLAELDTLFSQSNPGSALEIPTAVGFCMYIKRDALHDVGLFDVENFGRGYGEENDFCRRAVKKGWNNVLCCDTFVFHEGGVSFSTDSLKLMANAEQVIHRLHPDYHQLVQEHVALDPERIYRLNVAIQTLHQADRPVILAISHRLSGGIKKHIDELAGYLQEQAHFLLLKPVDDDNLVLQLDSLHESLPITFSLAESLDDLIQLLKYIGVQRLHFHHALGIAEEIWQIPELLDVPYDITLHDHFFINGNPAQCDEKGRFTRNLEQQSRPFPIPMPLDQWQEVQRLHLEGADRIICPSLFTAELYKEQFPGLEIIHAYHPDWEIEAPYPASLAPSLSHGEKLKVLVLGALSPEKGADVLEQTALSAQQKQLPLEFHLLGYAYRPLNKVIIEHGSYDHSNVVELIEQISPHLVWFPAMIPETFSYTLSEALRTGLPILAPDIGAFPNRLASRPLTWVEGWDRTADEWCKSLMAKFEQLAREDQNSSYEWAGQEKPQNGFYKATYLTDTPKSNREEVESIDLDWLANLFARSPSTGASAGSATKKEKVLRAILSLRRTAIGKLVSRVVPIQTQRNIKRRLSHKPVHEIEK